MPISQENDLKTLRAHLQQETETALAWVDAGTIRDDSSFLDPEGIMPFQGSLERLAQRTADMQAEGESWNRAFLARWCKGEADAWFEGFPDDSVENRKDFTASLFSLARSEAGLLP